MTAAGFIQDVLRNPHNRAILERLPRCGLPDAWLVAGCLFQTVWNLHNLGEQGARPEAQIQDYDIFYCDPTDLSAPAEQAAQARVAEVMAGIPVTIEVKNQARVHTWYEAHFGHPYPALASSCEGIDRFLIRCTCVGIQVSAGADDPRPLHERLTLYAPHGVVDLYAGVLRPNALTPHTALFDVKAASYRARWPGLRVSHGD